MCLFPLGVVASGPAKSMQQMANGTSELGNDWSRDSFLLLAGFPLLASVTGTDVSSDLALCTWDVKSGVEFVQGGCRSSVATKRAVVQILQNVREPFLWQDKD